jgi:hypothetical protein
MFTPLYPEGESFKPIPNDDYIADVVEEFLSQMLKSPQDGGPPLGVCVGCGREQKPNPSLCHGCVIAYRAGYMQDFKLPKGVCVFFAGLPGTPMLRRVKELVREYICENLMDPYTMNATACKERETITYSVDTENGCSTYATVPKSLLTALGLGTPIMWEQKNHLPEMRGLYFKVLAETHRVFVIDVNHPRDQDKWFEKMNGISKKTLCQWRNERVPTSVAEGVESVLHINHNLID